MTRTITDASNALKNFVKKQTRSNIPFWGRVVEINTDENTCNVEPIDGNPIYYDVLMTPSPDNITHGLIQIPEIGSFVLCGSSVNENDVYILMFGELAEIVLMVTNNIKLNGDKYSTIKGESLQEQLNILQNKVDLIINAIKNAVPATDNSGEALQTSMVAILQLAKDADFSNILNKRVRHGE